MIWTGDNWTSSKLTAAQDAGFAVGLVHLSLNCHFSDRHVALILKYFRKLRVTLKELLEMQELQRGTRTYFPPPLWALTCWTRSELIGEIP